MKIKKIHLFVFLVAITFLYGIFIMAKPETTIFDVSTLSLKNNFSTVHFNAGGNDFGGGTLWISTQKKLDAPIEITANGDTRKCSIKIEGLYYNSQRGERLWPLDQNTLLSLKKGGKGYDDLNVFGGLYTHCSKDTETKSIGTGDIYSIYGMVEHQIKGSNSPYFLVAGVKYDLNKNKIKNNSELHCTLQLINNKTPVGYLYDYQGGIGFVGGNVPNTETNEELSNILNQGKCITEIFTSKNENTIEGTINNKVWTINNQNSLENLKWNLAIRGIIGFTNDLFFRDRVNIEGNFGKKSQTIKTDAISLANAVNKARKKSEQLCRGKWNKNNVNTSSLYCFNGENGQNTINITNLIPGKTYIFKNTNVRLSNYMDSTDKLPVTVFIDRGQLFLPGNVNTGQLIDFNDQGYISNNESIAKGNYLKGNFIINGIVSSESQTGIENKLYIHGKLLSLNTYDEASKERIHAVKNLLGEANYNTSFINYRNLFSRRCENPISGIASDGSECKKGTSEFSRAPLSIIDMQWSSLLED